MKLYKWGIASLTVCLLANFLQTGALAQTANGHDPYRSASDAAQMARMALASYNGYNEWESCIPDEYADEGYSSDCNNHSCEDCGNYCCESPGNLCSPGGGLFSRPGQFFFGATYLYARADLSDARSYLEVDNVSHVDTYHQYDFQYDSSYSLDGGYRLCDCGGEIRFNFTRLKSDANFNVTNNSTTPGEISLYSRYDVNAIVPGDRLEGRTDVDLKSYYLGFAKTIPLGSPLGCTNGCMTCGDTCCDCGDICGSGLCPAWDIQWSAGIRAADVRWNHGNASYTDQAGDEILTNRQGTRMDFEGIGGQFGLEGRRYIGRKGHLSVYARGDLSLLVGTIHIDTQHAFQDGVANAFNRAKFQNIIPVTEITVGGTVHVREHFAVSAGYFLSAWHDLGMRDDFIPAGAPSAGIYDDANILGFDGLFVRGEVAF